MIKQPILCVDDENDNLDALERIFRSKYKVLRANSGTEALHILDQYPDPVPVIITDQRMPQMTGVEFLEKSILKRPDSIRILLTGYTDMESVVSAINTGQIYRYLNKPWDPVDLVATVERAIERFHMASELREKNVALEKANAELSTALNELKVLDLAKSKFMILINHELKTPLTTVLSFAELLKETKLSEEQEVCVGRIHRSGERLRELVDDVLLLVSAEMKTLKLKVHPFEKDQIQLTFKPEIEQLLKRKGQRVSPQYIDKKFVGDAAMVSQILSRLVSNAIKFGLDGSTIRIDAELISQHRVKFRVFNQGSSIADSVKEKVLRPFFIDEDVMNHGSGTGLGLTVCQSLLHAHGSSLDLINRDQGVEASFELACL